MEGNIIPSWAAGVNATYGNPIFIFNYFLPYYIVSLFHFVGFSFVSSMKLLLATTYLFSGICMYVAMIKLLKNKFAAFSSSIFYQFNPYHLVDVHFRATPGESTLFLTTPILLYFIVSYLQERKLKYFLGISLSVILITLSHPMVSLTIILLLTIYVLSHLNFKSLLKIALTFVAMGIGFISSLFLWVPFIIYKDVQYPINSNLIFDNNFMYLFYSPYKFGLLFQGPNGELNPPIGYFQLFVIVILTLLLFYKRKNLFNKEKYIFWLIAFYVNIFFIHSYSQFFWKYFPILSMLSGRLLFPLSFITSVCAGYFVMSVMKLRISHKVIYILIFILISSTILNWGQRRVISIADDKWLHANIAGTTKFLEGEGVWFANTKWANRKNVWFDVIPKQKAEIVRGDGIIKILSASTTKHTYITYSHTKFVLEEKTLWYPGWKLYINGSESKIYPGRDGVITAIIPSGLNYLVFQYTDILKYSIFKYLALFITGILVLLYTFNFLAHPKNFTRYIHNNKFLKIKNIFKKSE